MDSESVVRVHINLIISKQMQISLLYYQKSNILDGKHSVMDAENVVRM